MKTVAPIPEKYSEDLRKIISLMMQKDPGNRPSPRAILDRTITKQWITKIIYQKLIWKYFLTFQTRESCDFFLTAVLDHVA